MVGMGQKRKREGGSDLLSHGPPKPPPGTKTFYSGKAVRDALGSGSLQNPIALRQQCVTPYSALPLPLSHTSVVILQQYFEVSPNGEEIFSAWQEGDRTRNELQVEATADLLATVLDVLTPLPFFRKTVVGLVKTILNPSEVFRDGLNQLLQSTKREQTLIGLHLAATMVNVDPPDPASSAYGSSGKLALQTWTCLNEGGIFKLLAKMLNMRKRNRDKTVYYGPGDPYDKPDIRHAVLRLILPLLASSSFLTHCRPLMHPMFSGLASDPPLTVLRVLEALWSAIMTPSAGVARRVALALLDEKSLEHLLSLLSRQDVEAETGRSVADMAMTFLEGVTATPGKGICFPDEGWYPRGGAAESAVNGVHDEDGEETGSGYQGRGVAGDRKGLHNRILSNVVRKVGSKAVDDSSKVGEWLIKVLTACPELVAGYWPYSALALDPRLDAKWISIISYVGRIISLPHPPSSTFHLQVSKGMDARTMPLRSHPPPLANIIESILPAPLTKTHLSKGLLHPEGLVQHLTSLTLARAFQKLDAVQELLHRLEVESQSEAGSSDNPWSRIHLHLEMECRKRVPDISVVVAFAQKSATLARPADPEDEPDEALVARSNMLTESALRLFGLYHKTLPSIANDAKFDVGKLLVSSSSVKEERRAKKEARAGSVISDAGSAMSVGTLGTAGMGGGFGQSRGDVQGFEAMCQVHVLSLLTAVREWQWTNKAAGSQFTYLYHILMLYISTPHPVTRRMTNALLERLLLPTLVFSHDHDELSVFLSALPHLPPSAPVEDRALLLTQQIHLLSFLDDCVRRCVKTPHRYIEESLDLLPNYFNTSKPETMVSPLFMTVLEQLRAKILGELISSEAAGVIMAYLRRVMLGLMGKTEDGKFLTEVASRLRDTVREARNKGQQRTGLLGSVGAIQRDLCEVFGMKSAEAPSEEDFGELADEQTWSHASLERRLVDDIRLDIGVEKTAKALSKLVKKAASSTVERDGGLCLTLLASHPDRAGFTLNILEQCLAEVTGSPRQSLKEAIFDNASIKSLYLTNAGDVHRTVLEKLAAHLDAERPEDIRSANLILRELVDDMTRDSKGKNIQNTLPLLRPWTRLLSKEQVSAILEHILHHAKRISLTTDSTTVISELVICCQNVGFVLQHLDALIKFGVLGPVASLLCSNDDEAETSAHGDLITTATVKLLLDLDTEDANCVLNTPFATSSLSKVMKDDPASASRVALLPAYELLVDAESNPDTLPSTVMVDTALKALGETESEGDGAHSSAFDLLRHVLHSRRPEAIRSIAAHIRKLFLPTFTVAHLGLALSLAESGIVEVQEAASRLIDLGLQRAVRICSSGDHLSAQDEVFLSLLSEVIKLFPTIDLNLDSIETLLTAVIQDGLEDPNCTTLAAHLCSRGSLKASFVRQHLDLVLGSKGYSSLASSSSNPGWRAQFVDLLSALFLANTYTSCQPQFIEPLLPLYQGSLSSSDRKLLYLFQSYERYRHQSVSSLLQSWSASGTGSARTLEALTSLDSAKVHHSCVKFPLRRTLQTSDEAVGDHDTLYDPLFILCLLGGVLQEDLSGLDWVDLLRTNALGVAVCALASRDAGMRDLASFILTIAQERLVLVTFHEKPELLHTLHLLRHSIPEDPSGSDPPVQMPRLPTITTLFLAHALRAISTPAHPLYPTISRFLLQRPTFDLQDVPMLLSMLYSSEDGFKRERKWMVTLVRDGIRSTADWAILKRRKTIDLFKTLYQTSNDAAFRKVILEALENTSVITAAAFSMVYRSGFISWLTSQWNGHQASHQAVEETKAYLRIFENLLIALRSKDTVIEGRAWIHSAERLISLASKSADAGSLETLSRCLRRLSSPTSGISAKTVLPSLINRLEAIYPDVNRSSEAYNHTVENLFEVSLSTGLPIDGNLLKTVCSLETSLGEWTRRERRRCLWGSRSNEAIDV